MNRWALLLLVMLLPLGAAQESAATTLYFHLDAHQDFPINTQLPDDRYADATGRGLLAPTTTCIPVGDTLPQVSRSFHTRYGFSTPGYVEYDFQEYGGPRIHPERGISFDVNLDSAVQPVATIYIETTALGGGGDASLEALPVVLPQFAASVIMRTGDDVSVGGAAYEQGTVIMEGMSAPRDLYPGVEGHLIVDGANVYEIQVPLDLKSAVIPRDESYNVRLDLLMRLPSCEDPDAHLTTSNVQYHTSPAYRPRIDLAVQNPLRWDYAHPEFIRDELFIHLAINSPWGNYDVDESDGGIEVAIEGPTEAVSLYRAAFVQAHHEHGKHQEAVKITYVWPYDLDSASQGDYALKVTAWNDQRTASESLDVSFNIGDFTAIDSDGNVVEATDVGEKESSLGVLVGILGLAAAMVVSRRRS